MLAAAPQTIETALHAMVAAAVAPAVADSPAPARGPTIPAAAVADFVQLLHQT